MKKRSDLQGVRGVAILSVLVYHFLPDWFKNGYVGVDQFFILSGFLMAETLSKHSRITLNVVKEFYYRRFRRILPLYILCIALTIISLFFLFSKSTFIFNYQYAKRALLFITNVPLKDDVMDYQQQVENAKILFTHTWSLSVEIQFYLLAPIIILFPVKNIQKHFVLLLGAVSYIAFTYLSTFPETQSFAFYNLSTRLWQFSLGIICSFYLHIDESDLECGRIQKRAAFSETSKNAIVCLQTTGAIFTGADSPNRFLSNRFLVYLGDISYSLYLVHWPVVAYFEENYHSLTGSLVGMLLSILLAVVLTESYEKWYLSLTFRPVIILTGFLYAACGCLLYVNNVEVYKNDGFDFVAPKITTIQEAIDWNVQSAITDGDKLKLPECDYKQMADFEEPPWSYCRFQNISLSGKKRVMLIGNSYSTNIARMFIHIPECLESASEMNMYTRPGCEVLEETTQFISTCKGSTAIHLERIRYFHPDILFILTRHLESRNDSPNPLIDEILGQEIRNLAEIEKEVKERVYILNAFPAPVELFTNEMNTKLQDGTLNHLAVTNTSANYQQARSRMEILAAQCTKCELIDIMPTFMVDGVFQMYEETTKLQHFTNGLHLSDLGLSKVMPVFVDACKRI